MKLKMSHIDNKRNQLPKSFFNKVKYIQNGNGDMIFFSFVKDIYLIFYENKLMLLFLPKHKNK